MRYIFPTMSSVHLPLAEDLHQGLRRASKELGRPVTELVREALVAWLAELERQRVREEIESYARANAGTIYDLDPVWEDASNEAFLAAEGPAPKRRRR